MHEFNSDFYGHRISIVMLGYIRPELDYTSRGMTAFTRWSTRRADRPVFSEDLIQDIEKDKQVAIASLARPAYKAYETYCPTRS